MVSKRAFGCEVDRKVTSIAAAAAAARTVVRCFTAATKQRRIAHSAKGESALAIMAHVLATQAHAARYGGKLEQKRKGLVRHGGADNAR